ncbi:Antithrombin-III [Thelohanellus kitauei]|uniref:Antithrombin-III n=1 Tax=Thelohanellus kitauei TaxID=669202 RepID=A0A0C2J4S3_THEKT|nr:Antithrombin-III [Thelohanellus kitauei]
MAEKVNEFTFKLANFLIEEDGRLFAFSISGFIAYLTLSLVNKGLTGSTKDQLIDLLNCNFSNIEISNTRSRMENQCTDLLRMNQFSKIGSAKSAIFHSKPVMEIFSQIALEYYDTEMRSVDPTNNDLQQARINAWGNTLLEVPYTNIFVESYNEELSLLIMNEYFARFKWKIPFHPQATRRGFFKDIGMNEIAVNFLKKVEYLKYYNDTALGASIVFLSLEEYDTYGAIVLPYPDNNIQDLLRKIKSQKIYVWFHDSDAIRIELHLPEFELVNRISLKPFLEHNKLSSLFNKNGADLTNMIKNGAFINDYMHVSSIRLNDKGSYVTTATEDPRRSYTSSKTLKFIADKPFILYFYDKSNNLILYISVVTTPFNYYKK